MKALSAILLLLALGYGGHGLASPVNPGGAPPPQDWPAYGGDLAEDHYSALDQINRQNVGKLKVAWTFDTGEKGSWLETNPLIVAGVLYAYTPSQKVFALNAATGKPLWIFDSGISGKQPTRGVAYWTDGQQSRLFAGIMNFLYALDPSTGKPIPGFGENGRIDLRKGLGGDYLKQSVVLTSPGILYKDLIIVGGRNPETAPAPPGDIRAFDVHTGALRWRFQTIPHPGDPGYETWPKDAWKTAGAANCWAGMALDEKRGIVYAPTGSAVPDFYGGARLGDDLFADTLLALDAATGKLIWHFQGVHHDLWDRDFPTAPVLLTIRRGGKAVDVVAQATKQGFLFVLDRETGNPIFPIEERPVPASTVPGERSSPTQPFPSLPAPYAMQAVTEADLTDRTPEAHQWALNEFRTFRSAGQFVPLSVGIQTIAAPGFDGGSEWGGPGVDIRTGVIYLNANNIANTGGLVKADASASLGARTYGSQCALCHGVNRAGSPPDFPSLLWIDQRKTPLQIAETIHQGQGRMPAFPNVQDGQLDALLSYLKRGSEPASKELTQSALAAPPGAPAANADSHGSMVYASQCAICHGDHEEGIPPSFPSLLGVGQRESKAQILTLIRNGRGRMPAFSESRVSTEDAASLMRFLGVSATVATDADQAAASPYNFTGYRKFYDQEGYPATRPPWGTLNAIDLNTGEYLWRIPFGEYPELAAKGVPTTGTENYGGPVITAGGLVFIGATVFDHKVRVFDSRSGKLLWESVLPVAGVATPSTYMVNGKQFVVIAAGGGRDPKLPQGGSYIAFALP